MRLMYWEDLSACYSKSANRLPSLQWIAGFQTMKEKWSHFDLKSWVTGETIIRPGIPSNWRIFDSNWLNIEGQFQNWLNIEGQFQNWLNIEGQFQNWLNIEGKFQNWLSISSQFDSKTQYRVNMNKIFSNYSESRVEF